MFDKDAIRVLTEAESITAASNAVGSGLADLGALALPADFKVHDLEQFMGHRRRPRATVTTRFIKSFADYAKKHKDDGATVFLNPESMNATGVLDLGSVQEPGHADSRVLLVLEKTAAYAALCKIIHAPQAQTVVAEFFEDWPAELQFFNEVEQLDRGAAVAAVRKITVDEARKVENQEQKLSASMSALESVSASSGGLPLPTHVYFKCQPYAELAERTFVMRFGVLTSTPKPQITLRVALMDQHVEEMSDELAMKLEVALGDEIPIVIGTYQKAA